MFALVHLVCRIAYLVFLMVSFVFLIHLEVGMVNLVFGMVNLIFGMVCFGPFRILCGNLCASLKKIKVHQHRNTGTSDKYGHDYITKRDRNDFPVKIEKYILGCPFFNLSLCGIKSVKSASCIVSYWSPSSQPGLGLAGASSARAPGWCRILTVFLFLIRIHHQRILPSFELGGSEIHRSQTRDPAGAPGTQTCTSHSPSRNTRTNFHLPVKSLTIPLLPHPPPPSNQNDRFLLEFTNRLKRALLGKFWCLEEHISIDRMIKVQEINLNGISSNWKQHQMGFSSMQISGCIFGDCGNWSYTICNDYDWRVPPRSPGLPCLDVSTWHRSPTVTTQNIRKQKCNIFVLIISNGWNSLVRN